MVKLTLGPPTLKDILRLGKLSGFFIVIQSVIEAKLYFCCLEKQKGG